MPASREISMAWCTPPPPHSLLCFVLLLISEPQIRLPPAASPKFAESLNSSIWVQPAPFQPGAKKKEGKGAVINQRECTYDGSGTKPARINIPASVRRWTADSTATVSQRSSSGGTPLSSARGVKHLPTSINRVDAYSFLPSETSGENSSTASASLPDEEPADV